MDLCEFMKKKEKEYERHKIPESQRFSLTYKSLEKVKFHRNYVTSWPHFALLVHPSV